MRPIRTLPITAFAFAALASAPAVAEEPRRDSDMEALTDKLGDPAEQERLAGMVEAMGYMLMQMPIGPLADAFGNVTGEPVEVDNPDARLADYAGPRAQEIPSQIADRVPQMMGMLAQMGVSAQKLAPALEEWAKEMGKQVDANR